MKILCSHKERALFFTSFSMCYCPQAVRLVTNHSFFILIKSKSYFGSILMEDVALYM